MDFRTGDRGHAWKNHGISIFGPNISRCFKTGSILLVIEQQYLIGPKNVGFSAGKL